MKKTLKLILSTSVLFTLILTGCSSEPEPPKQVFDSYDHVVDTMFNGKRTVYACPTEAILDKCMDQECDLCKVVEK